MISIISAIVTIITIISAIGITMITTTNAYRKGVNEGRLQIIKEDIVRLNIERSNTNN